MFIHKENIGGLPKRPAIKIGKDKAQPGIALIFHVNLEDGAVYL